MASLSWLCGGRAGCDPPWLGIGRPALRAPCDDGRQRRRNERLPEIAAVGAFLCRAQPAGRRHGVHALEPRPAGCPHGMDARPGVAVGRRDTSAASRRTRLYPGGFCGCARLRRRGNEPRTAREPDQGDGHGKQIPPGQQRMTVTPTRLGALTTIGLHALVLGAMLSYAPARSALFSAAPIMVDWIVPAKPEPRIEPPKPKPVKTIRKPVEKPPVAVLPAEAPAAMVAPEPPPPPPVEPVAMAPAPVVLIPPIFNADYLDNPAPTYPPLSRRLGEQGRVVLRVLVNPGGRADEVQIATPSGHPRLDDMARETVKRWKFVAAKRGAEAVSAWVLIPISFKLEG